MIPQKYPKEIQRQSDFTEHGQLQCKINKIKGLTLILMKYPT